MQFSDLRLSEPLLKALQTEGYHTATPIQAKAIPPILDGRDVLGCAQTGTGKTAAFALPILQRLSEHKAQSRAPRCLILCPTRELAVQINDGFRAYGRNVKLSSVVIFGGVGQNPQVDALRRGVDIVIATPGRLLDLINQRFVDLRSIEMFVLDEADRMLDMGFINDIRKIVALVPPKRQTLLFSATMPFEIRKLADQLLHKPESIQIAAVAAIASAIEETVYFVEKQDKSALLAHLYDEMSMARTIVFTRTKHGADKVVKSLHRYGIRAEAIHGNKSQNARQRALDNFKAGKTPMLVATDIASRGIDVDMISHVVNYDLTHEPETYVHRIGRTARAGQTGAAVSFCDREERENLRAIEKLTKRTLRVEKDLPVLKRLETSPEDSHRHQSRPENRSQQSHGGRTGHHAPRGQASSHDAGRPSTPRPAARQGAARPAGSAPGGGVRAAAPKAGAKRRRYGR
jgi:ATP-dependent RNA helicase RhlE